MCSMSIASHTDAKLTSCRLRVVSLLSWRFLTKPDCILSPIQLIKLSFGTDNRARLWGNIISYHNGLRYFTRGLPNLHYYYKRSAINTGPNNSFPNCGRKWSSKGVPDIISCLAFLEKKTSIWVLKTTTIFSRVYTQAGCFSRQTIYLRICQVPCLSARE